MSIRTIATALTVVGALNWGLVGLAQFDLVATLFGGRNSMLSRIVYGLVGLSGGYLAATLVSDMQESHEPRLIADAREAVAAATR